MTVPIERLPDPGFGDPVFDAQGSFRAVLDALARPGTVRALVSPQATPEPLTPAATALALTLIDHDTPVWLDEAARGGEVGGFLRFHCGCPLTDDPLAAAFALVTDALRMPGLETFHPGEDRYPDGSTTVVVGLPALAGGPAVTLSGPGIETAVEIAPRGLPGDFWDRMARNRAIFPLGVDVILAAGCEVLGLPRTVRAEA